MSGKSGSGFGGRYALIPGLGRTVGRISQYRVATGSVALSPIRRSAAGMLASARSSIPCLCCTLAERIGAFTTAARLPNDLFSLVLRDAMLSREISDLVSLATGYPAAVLFA